MKSINEASIICKNCNTETVKSTTNKGGFQLRAWKCRDCNEEWIHPLDLQEYKNFKIMRNKVYRVKLRLVGNSYAVSIPREIIDYQENLLDEIDNIIKMSLESPEKLSLYFTKKIEEGML